MNQTETLETFTMTVGSSDYVIPARFNRQMEDIMEIDNLDALIDGAPQNGILPAGIAPLAARRSELIEWLIERGLEA